MQHLVTAKNSPAEIPNLKEYYDGGIEKFLIVVVNSQHNGTDYLGSTYIELKIEVKQENFNRCSVQYSIKHDMHRVKIDYDDAQYESDLIGRWYMSTLWNYNGDFIDNIFTGNIHPTTIFDNQIF